MLRPGGYSVLNDPDRPLAEADTITCGHCQRVVFIKPGLGATVYLIYSPTTGLWTEEAGAGCHVCGSPVCLSCHDKRTCTPWEKQMEAQEQRARLLTAVLG